MIFIFLFIARNNKEIKISYTKINAVFLQLFHSNALQKFVKRAQNGGVPNGHISFTPEKREDPSEFNSNITSLKKKRCDEKVCSNINILLVNTFFNFQKKLFLSVIVIIISL
jgi:hypothetical protein